MCIPSTLTTELRHWIDSATYFQLLERWRFSPVGDPIFVGEAGDYYKRTMMMKHDKNPAEAINASKQLG